MASKIPKGKLARGSIAGITAAKLGAGHLKHKVKRPFLSAKQHQKNTHKLNDESADILFKALTKLRGTALKIAQMIGMEQGLLPDAYLQELEKSFYRVPPLNRVLVRKLIMNAFNKSPEKLFAQFEPQAFAAASLGQVHRATHSNGDKLAVKVQYPGIGVSIESDLAIMRTLARGLPDTRLLLRSLQEIESRLKEEVDYCMEARNTQWFRQNVTLSGINIPLVYPELSSQHVLTTEYFQGYHLHDWLATQPSRATRNKAAQLLYDFFVHTSQDLRHLHADPNPGNYLFHEDGSVSVLDFGCTRKLSEQSTAVFPDLLRAYINDDAEALFSAYKNLGMSIEPFNAELYQRVLQPFGQWLALPFKTDSFDFGKHATYSQQGKAVIQNLNSAFKADDINQEFIFHNRTIYGLVKIFERMGATVRLRHHWM